MTEAGRATRCTDRGTRVPAEIEKLTWLTRLTFLSFRTVWCTLVRCCSESCTRSPDFSDLDALLLSCSLGWVWALPLVPCSLGAVSAVPFVPFSCDGRSAVPLVPLSMGWVSAVPLVPFWDGL